MNLKSIFSKSFLLMALLVPNTSFGADVKQENVNKVDDLIKTGKFILVDVRTLDEYNDGHIKGSIHIDYKDINFKKNFQEKFKDKNADYILYCRSGVRSDNAAKSLTKLGYKNLINMKGGIIAWEEAGKEVE